MRRLALFFLLISAPFVASAEDPPQPRDAAIAKDAPAPAETGLVPVPPATEKALQYYRSGNVLWGVDVTLGFLVPIAFVFTGFSARLRYGARKVGRNWFFTLVVYFVFFALINYVIALPWAYYTEFVRQHDYGLSNQTLGKWFSDSLKGLMVGLVMGALFLWVPFLLLKKSPHRWWLYTSILAVPFLFLMIVVAPIWIDPLFNDFGPMKDRGLEQRILALADRAGIEGSRVFEVNKSVDTKAVNAFFAVLILVTLYLAHRTAGFFFARHRERMGFDSLADPAALPPLLLLTNMFSFLASPITLAYRRHNEHEADRFALEITRDNHAFGVDFVKLQTENLGNPRPAPLYVLWRASHPPIGERIDFCNAYRPWEKGDPLHYEKLFRGTPARATDLHSANRGETR